ncbi:hypothetical protein LOTGIDRAFT_159285 [Lottia gigantea]|uniref:Uncharacterized protein n=1 Tax=Lottia gigantea TaxID=225164 RepID=V4AJH3_LOTGI|nr:hypothetical protein LOTGIDRAFT_159285 [Lottia gigantea]ESO97262.1 hypothetical protein LOTGIDRAFT_159285 [Lottia gigantea]
MSGDIDSMTKVTCEKTYGEEDCPQPTVDEYEKFCTIREETIRLLHDTADELDKLAKDVRISNIAGSAGGVVSAGLIVGGVIGSVFTMGASLVLTAVGAGLGVASAATSIGATIADSVISKKRQAQINEALVKDNQALKVLFNMCQKFEVEIDEDEKIQRVVTGAASVGKAAIVVGDTSRVAINVMKGAGRAVAVGGLVISVITLPIDIATLVINSKAIHEQKPHEMAEHFRTIAKQLTDNLRDEVLPCLFDNTEFFLENDLNEYKQ